MTRVIDAQPLGVHRCLSRFQYPSATMRSQYPAHSSQAEFGSHGLRHSLSASSNKLTGANGRSVSGSMFSAIRQSFVVCARRSVRSLCGMELSTVFLHRRICLIHADVAWAARIDCEREVCRCAMFLCERPLSLGELPYNKALQRTAGFRLACFHGVVGPPSLSFALCRDSSSTAWSRLNTAYSSGETPAGVLVLPSRTSLPILQDSWQRYAHHSASVCGITTSFNAFISDSLLLSIRVPMLLWGESRSSDDTCDIQPAMCPRR